MEPIPPAAAAPHLVAARQLRCPSATRGGTAHLARAVRPLSNVGMWKMVAFALLSGGVFLALTGALLFGFAGRWDLPFFWAYLGVWTAGCVVGPFVVDPTLMKERLRPGPGGKDYAIAIVIAPLWLGQYITAGLDVGVYHWSDTVPLAVQIIGLLAMAAALAVAVWASAGTASFRR